MNKVGLKLVMRWEGLKLKAYFCPAGVLTIGYGHTSAAGGPTVEKGLMITKKQAEEILAVDIKQFDAYVRSYVKVPMTGNQFAAMSSLCMNIGPGNFKKSSVLRELNKGHYDAVPAKFALWNKARNTEGKLVVLKGLVNRRAEEANLFMTVEKGVVDIKTPSGTKAECTSSFWDTVKGYFS